MRLLHAKRFVVLILFTAMICSVSQADNLTNLFDTDSSLLSQGGPSFVGGEADFGVNGRALGDEILAANGFGGGWTMNATFTPVASDVMAGETRLIMEIGGTSNGTGLWLVEGVPSLALKTGGGLGVPASFVANDLNITDTAAALFSNYGSLTAGTPYTVAASWNGDNQFTFAVQDDNTQEGVVEMAVVEGTSNSYNWYGNSTFTLGDTFGDIGSYGGLNDTAGNLYTAADASSMAGSFDDLNTLFWNDSSDLSVGIEISVLTINVNHDSGNITIDNPTGSAVTVDAATLVGGRGGFDSGEGPMGTVNLTGGGLVTIGPGSSEILPGVSWVSSPFTDAGIALEVDGTIINPSVSYTGSPEVLADYDGSGSVDPGDWSTILTSMNTDISTLDGINRYLAGDITGNGQVDRNDFRLLKELAIGGGAGLSNLNEQAIAVPEPTALALLILGSATCLICRRGAKKLVMLMLLVGMIAGSDTSLTAADIYTVDNTGAIRTFTGIDAGSAPMNGNTVADGVLQTTVAAYGSYQGFTSIPDGTVYGVNSAGAIDSWPTLSDWLSNTNVTNAAASTFGPVVTTTPRTGIHGLSFDGNTGGFYVVYEGFDEREGDVGTYSNLNSLYEDEPSLVTPSIYAGNVTNFYYPDEDAPAQEGSLEQEDALPGSNYLHVTGGGALEGWNDLLSPGYGYAGPAGTPGGIGSGSNRSFDSAGFGNSIIGAFSIVPDTEEISLLVDTATGAVSLKRATGGDRTIDFLRIQSPGGGLLETGYTGIGANAEFPAGDGLGGEGWDVAQSNIGNINDKREYFAFNDNGSLGSSTISGAGDIIPLGIFYDTAQDLQDLLVYYDQIDPMTGEFSTQTITGGVFIEYVESEGLVGDYNNDSVVDAADYTVWRDNLGGVETEFPNRSSALSGTTISELDYDVWVSNYGASVAVLSSAVGVPEPTSLAILLFGASLGCCSRSSALRRQ